MGLYTANIQETKEENLSNPDRIKNILFVDLKITYKKNAYIMEEIGEIETIEQGKFRLTCFYEEIIKERTTIFIVFVR